MLLRGSINYQVLVGLNLLGPYTLYPHTGPDTWAFYRQLLKEHLVTEVILGEGKSEFSITPEAIRLLREVKDLKR